MYKRYICSGLIILSLVFLVFGTCLKFEKDNGIFDFADDLLGMVGYLGIYSDDVNASSILREVKQFSSSLADGKLSGGEAWLDTFRASKVMKAVYIDIGDEEDMNYINRRLLPYKILFPIIVICGAVVCAEFLLGRKCKHTLVYLILLAGMVLAIILFKPASFLIGAGPILAFVAAGGAFIVERSLTAGLRSRTAVGSVSAKSAKAMKDLMIETRSDFGKIKDDVMKRAGYVPEKENTKVKICYCGNCGNAVGEHDVFCGRCGKKIDR